MQKKKNQWIQNVIQKHCVVTEEEPAEAGKEDIGKSNRITLHKARLEKVVVCARVVSIE